MSPGPIVLALALTALGAGDRPVRVDGRTPVTQGSLYYRAVGDGLPLVVVHGGPNLDFRYLYEPLLPFADTRRLVFYDQRGVGLSESPLTPSLIRLDRYVEDLDALRASLGADRIALLGHSWGGLVAMAYAWTHPERVESLVLVSPIEPGRRFAGALRAAVAARLTEEHRTRLERVRRSEAYRRGEVAAVEEVLRLGFRAGTADPERVAEMRLDLAPRTAADGAAVVALIFRDPGSFDRWERLGEIRAPTLVVHGVHDAAPAEMAREIAAAIPRAELLVLEEAGHFPYLEAPQPFRAAVVDFLDRAARRSAAEVP